MGSLESIVEVDDEWVVGLLQDIGLDDGVFELLLHDQILLLEGLESILFARLDVLD